MFIVYHSNRPELFMRLVINVMSNNQLSDPMQSEIILTEHKILDQWIEIQLAEYFGISANITFMKVKYFINKIFQETLINTNCNINVFSHNFMYWKFMEILPKICSISTCSIIQEYLSDDINQQKCGQLSEQLVNLFHRYLIYRPDWLKIWRSNKIVDNLDDNHQIWQSEIWRIFIEQNNKYTFNILNYLNNFVLFFQQDLCKIKKTKLPDRIFIYGVTSMPPVFWRILKCLSDEIDIYLWFISPCIHFNYFNDSVLHIYPKKYALDNHSLYISSYSKKINSDTMNNSCSNNYFNVELHHPLLKSWGNTGKDTLYLLKKIDNLFEIKSYIVPKKQLMLHILQKKIIEFQNCIVNLKNYQNNNIIFKKHKKYILNLSDQSITVHICHNIQREIEVLHDNILHMLSDDPLLLPGEIVVMAPDINYYVPAIKTVFNNIFGRKLPFVISSKYKKNTHSIISSMLNILNISYSRCTSEEILSFLSVSSIASRFNLDIEEIKLLSKWTLESGIRWGLDDKTMLSFDVPVTKQNTWDFGLKRMLLGYAMNNQTGIWKKFLPYDDYVNKDNINIIGKLGEFLNVLKKWRDRLSYSYTLKEWLPFVQEIIDDFFYCSDVEEKNILILLKNCWNDLLFDGIQLDYSKNVSITVLRDKLYLKLNKEIKDYQFLPNSINFFDISPICCIPCKVLCLIGMHHNNFPNNKLDYDFNLILKKPRCGDSNCFEKDYYTFLLAFLLPQERIYISYIKQLNSLSNTDEQSVLLNEFIEYIAENFCLIGDENLNFIDNTKRVRKHLFQQYTFMPCDISNFISNTKIHSFANEWLYTDKFDFCTNYSIESICSTSLPPVVITEILFSDLYNFYCHPVRMWFQKRLGVVYIDPIIYQQQSFNDEPFCMDDLNRFKLNTELINCLMYNKDVNELYYRMSASGILPYGSFGQLFWMSQYEKMHDLSVQIKQYYLKQSYNLNIFILFDKIRLIGTLYAVQKNGLIRWKSSNLFMKDYFLMWLEHLVYCSMGGSGDSRIFGINEVWHFPNFSEIQAKELLYILISGYCTGINIPLLLLYKSGGIWINNVFDWDNKIIYPKNHVFHEKARQKLIQTWQGNSKYPPIGEFYDPYLRKVMSFYLNSGDIDNIINIAKQYFFNLMKYRVL